MIKYGRNIGKMPNSRMFNKVVLALAIFLSTIDISGCAADEKGNGMKTIPHVNDNDHPHLDSSYNIPYADPSSFPFKFPFWPSSSHSTPAAAGQYVTVTPTPNPFSQYPTGHITPAIHTTVCPFPPPASCIPPEGIYSTGKPPFPGAYPNYPTLSPAGPIAHPANNAKNNVKFIPIFPQIFVIFLAILFPKIII